MVSGFFTSPYDQERIMSGEAKPMRMASKSTTSPWFLNKLIKSFIVFLVPFAGRDGLASVQSSLRPRYPVRPDQASCSKSMFSPSERISFISTLKDSGMLASMLWLLSTMFLYILLRPMTSSDLTVSISCRV